MSTKCTFVYSAVKWLLPVSTLSPSKYMKTSICDLAMLQQDISCIRHPCGFS